MIDDDQRVKTMQAPDGGYYGLTWNEKTGRYKLVKSTQGKSFETRPEALRAARHRVGNVFKMTAACPLPPPEPDFDSLGVNKWRQRKTGAAKALELTTFGNVRIGKREVVVERKKKGRRVNAKTSV